MVFFSTSDVHRDRTSLDFLMHISKAAILAISDEFGDLKLDARADESEVSCAPKCLTSDENKPRACCALVVYRHPPPAPLHQHVAHSAVRAVVR